MSVKEIYQSVNSNLYFQLIRRILVVYLLYTLCRLVFFWYNHDLYGSRTFVQLFAIFSGGLLFDTTAILYTNLAYILMFLLPFRFRYKRAYQTAAKYLSNCGEISVFYRQQYHAGSQLHGYGVFQIYLSENYI